jgi:tRNA dimethylallyltransferase
MSSSVDSDGAEVRVVCGPTAAGKSAVAMWLAERWPVTIISADSRQIYRGFDIGTAKPSADERKRVPHRGIDIAEPGERFSAAAWAKMATEWVDAAGAAARVPLVVGGTGLYLRALFEGLFEAPALDPARREAIERYLAALETAELRRWTEALDPARAHLGRTQLLRAIEVALLIGRPLSALHREYARPSRLRARYLLVDPGPRLANQIEARIDAMLAAGWEEEVRALARAVPEEAPAWKSTGYRALRRVIDGASDWTGARASIVIETRQYAKRQRTWFRHQLPARAVTMLDPHAPDWRERAERWWYAIEGEEDRS